MEKYIGFAILLFLLSMICERLADFLKHFIGEQNTIVSVLLKRIFRIGDTIDKGPMNSVAEDKRYYRILKINILCGFVTAVALHADIFTILQNLETPENALNWKNSSIWWFTHDGEKQHILQFLLGCFGTGLFISFGSKFWHDMLDLLLEVKNLRRKMNDQRTFQVDNINSFDAFIKAPESKLALTAAEQYQDQISRIPGVISSGPGYMDINGQTVGCVEVHFSNEKAMQDLPATLNITIGTMSVPIPVNKIFTGKAVIHFDRFGAGFMTANTLLTNGWGSLGCIVKKKKGFGNEEDRYLLSCHHVLSANADISKPEVKQPVLARQLNDEAAEKMQVADFEEGERSEKLDAAIAKIREAFVKAGVNNDAVLNPRQSKKLTALDAKSKLPVRILSKMQNGEISGYVFNDTWNQSLIYNDGEFTLNDLIILTRDTGTNHRPLSVKGDSGSLVIDKLNNQAIGIVVGGDSRFTYAVKMSNIEDRFKIELI
jgi:hypothetical protein